MNVHGSETIGLPTVDLSGGPPIYAFSKPCQARKVGTGTAVLKLLHDMRGIDHGHQIEGGSGIMDLLEAGFGIPAARFRPSDAWSVSL